MGEKKERELLRRLKEKYDKIDAKKEKEDNFDLGMACLNLMNELRLSVTSFRKLKRWCEDVLARGGDLGKLPSDIMLRKLKQELVPQGLVATAKEARVGLQQTLDHTPSRSPTGRNLLTSGRTEQTGRCSPRLALTVRLVWAGSTGETLCYCYCYYFCYSNCCLRSDHSAPLPQTH